MRIGNTGRAGSRGPRGTSPSRPSSAQIRGCVAATSRTSAGRRVPPRGSKSPYCSDAQERGLHRGRELANLVEEKRAAVGAARSARLARSAPVNAPFWWPNSSDSRRVSGNAAQLTTTNGFEAARGPVEVERFGHELPGSALAAHEDGRIGARDLHRPARRPAASPRSSRGCAKSRSARAARRAGGRSRRRAAGGRHRAGSAS